MSAVELIEPNRLLLSGNINFYTAAKLTKKAVELFLTHPVKIIDLHNTEQCDSASLLFLLYLWRLAAQRQRGLQFINLPIKVKRLIKLSNLEKILVQG